MTGAATFLDYLSNGCMIESYFCEYMAELGMLFHDIVAPYLSAYAPEHRAA